MDPRLDEESRALAEMARTYGLMPYSLSSLGDSIKPFCLGMENGGQKLNSWHHADYQEQYRFQSVWDHMLNNMCTIAVIIFRIRLS